MNKYGRLAMEHWNKAAPSRVAELENPEAFFTELGELVMEQVVDLLPQIQGPDVPGEEYLAKVGRLNMARKQAEEMVLNELVWITEPEPSSPAEELMMLLGDMPSPGIALDVEDQMREEAEYQAEADGLTGPLFEDWELEKIEEYKKLDRWLVPISKVDEMTQTEIAAHLQGIRAFQKWEEDQKALWVRVR